MDVKTPKKTEGGHQKRKFGYVDRFLEILPEMHIMGYNYCGPNTNLKIRLASGAAGINKLDNACKEHDIAYNESVNLEWRCNADKILVLKATKRIYANDSGIGERVAALFVFGLMSIKIILVKIEICIKRVCDCLPLKSKRNTITKQSEN